MPAQFIHIDTYARVSPKKSSERQWTAQQIIDEARRAPGACPHVPNPSPPKTLVGEPLWKVEHVLRDRIEGARDTRGRRLRQDGKVLLAGVASYPATCGEVLANRRIAKTYTDWRDATCSWVRERFGDCLVSVIEHMDEGHTHHPHVHFLVIPHFRSGQKMEDLHPGMAARNLNKGGKCEKDAAYIGAMQGFQTDFWNAVSSKFDQTRMSEAPRKRWSYRQWKEIRTYVSALEDRLVSVNRAFQRLQAWIMGGKSEINIPPSLSEFGEPLQRVR